MQIPNLSEADWARIRGEFEEMPGVTYLNTGTCGRTPRPVLRVAAEWRQRLAAEPCEILWRRMPEALWPARERLAKFVNATPESITFMANVTAGVNTITSGVRLDPGRAIIVNDQEYGAMVYAWERAAARAGASLRTVELPSDPPFTRQDVVDRFDAALSSPAQLVFLSHITTTTGLILPVREICALARARRVLTMIDGAHAPGMIPVDVTTIGCDFYAANGHKWLLAPCGSGFLYIRPGLEDRVEPLVASWGLKYERTAAHQRDNDGSTPYIRSHEFQGTRDPAPWLSMPAAIEFLETIGTDQIQSRNLELARHTRRQLARIPGIEPATPDDPELSAALVSYCLPHGEPVAIQRRLWEQFRVETPVLDRPAGPLLRVSTHLYNTHDEIDRLHAALAALLA